MVAPIPGSSSRLLSLDALRGFTIALMILVNFPGSEDFVFFPLRHTVWNGLSVTDQVAPFFLFIIGVSIVLAFSGKTDPGSPRFEKKSRLYRKIIFRSLKIYAVGMLLNLMPDFNWAEIRWTGTLQRIAIVYPVCAILFLNTNWKQQVWTGSVLLIGYWLALTLIPLPGVGKVMLEPGMNIVAWFDNRFLPGSLWRVTWDPESILSTIPAIVSGITGMLAGRLMTAGYSPNEKVNYLMTAGVFSAIAGYAWGRVFPVNENLWTSSFVLVTSGFAALLFGASYFLIDIKGMTRFTKTGIVFGANAISIFFLADVWALFFYVWKPGGISLNERVVVFLAGAGMTPALASLLYALFFVCLNYIPAWLLYRKKIFIRL